MTQKPWYGKIVTTTKEVDLDGKKVRPNKPYIVTFLLGDQVLGLAPAWDKEEGQLALSMSLHNREMFEEDLTVIPQGWESTE